MAYGVYFNPAADVLFVLLAPEKTVTRHVSQAGVSALYAGETLVGYNVFAASESVAGLRPGLNPVLAAAALQALNARLGKGGFPPLEPLADSRYRVALVSALEGHPLEEGAWLVTLSLGAETLPAIASLKGLKVGEKVVVALEGCFLGDGTVFQRSAAHNLPAAARILTARELALGEETASPYLVGSAASGEDFYLGGHDHD